MNFAAPSNGAKNRPPFKLGVVSRLSACGVRFNSILASQFSSSQQRTANP